MRMIMIWLNRGLRAEQILKYSGPDFERGRGEGRTLAR